MRSFSRRSDSMQGALSRLRVALLVAALVSWACHAAEPNAGGAAVGASVGPTRGGEPTRQELESVDSALETVRAVCSDVLAEILAELRERRPGIEARQSGGRSKRNDYRNYQWISVKSGGCEYLLCTHHNDLDTRTGNPHVQMGRIQFWRCDGPHGPHSRDENGVWRYHFENADATLPRTRVWDDGFSAAAVADRFLAFMDRTAGPEGAEAATRDARHATGAARAEETDSPLANAAPVGAARRAARADEAIETIRAVESKAMAAIVAELRRRHPDWAVRSSHGNSRLNDYRCYQWITIRPGDGGAYWITMMFNDQDPYTGNTHTQFGRIQFWRGIVQSDQADQHSNNPTVQRSNGPTVQRFPGPHTRDAGGWRFRSDKQWASMPRLHLWSPEYSTAHVVDLFERFLAEDMADSRSESAGNGRTTRDMRHATRGNPVACLPPPVARRGSPAAFKTAILQIPPKKTIIPSQPPTPPNTP